MRRETVPGTDAAQLTAGQGSGRLYGTSVHEEFRAYIQARIVPSHSNVFTEVTYSHELVGYWGKPGSIRLDAVVGSPNAPLAIFDLKTGGAKLEPWRISEIQSHLPPGYKDIPIYEVKPQ